jgi:hypothetical protein
MKNFLLTTTVCIATLLTSCETDVLTETEDLLQDVTTKDLNPDATTLSSKTASSNNWYYILNRENGQSLSVETSNNDVVTWPYWGGNSQKWYLQSVGNNYFRLSPGHNTNLALNIAGASTGNGGDAIVYGYVNQHNEHFKFNDVGSGYATIVPRHSNRVLDYYSNSGDVVQWDYWGGDKQKWILIPAGGNGQLSWRWTTTNVPRTVRGRIETAMNAAVARYNKWGNWPRRTLTVEYNTNVPTADGNPNGNIRFGSNINYQSEWAALHEIAHTMGVGFWESRLINGSNNYVGAHALAVYRSFEGKSANISTGGSHFWNYGLNFNNEGTETNKERHAQIVWAMRCDGMITY